MDDYPDNRELMAFVLERQGFRVATAANGEQALAEAHRRPPCIILLDLMMPVMTGEEFREAQMKDGALCDIPVIVVSAHWEGRDIAERMSAAACLQKPVDFDDLTRRINMHCRSGCH